MCALFVPFSDSVVDHDTHAPDLEDRGWSIERAEALLASLTGVVSARVVARANGEVEEIHLLTTMEVSPKQTVRNVESALLAQLDVEVDHRKISVAQTSQKLKKPEPEAEPDIPRAEEAHAAPGVTPLDRPMLMAVPEPVPEASEERIIFRGHQFSSDGPRKVRVAVELEWGDGGPVEGEAVGTDLPKSRLETVAQATTHALEICAKEREDCDDQFTLAVDGVRLIDAFERKYVLVSVHAITGRDATPLVGSANVSDSPERAVILATLQAADRWVRGRASYGS